MADVKINVKVVSDAAKASVKSLGAETVATEKAFKSLNVSVSNTTSAFKVFAGNLAASAIQSLTSGLFTFAGASIKTAQEIEKVTTQLEVLTKSAGTANAIVKDLQEFAASTPFQFQDLAEATQKLIAFGFSTKEAKDNLVVLGDVAGASGANIQELSFIFGQVRAESKLTGERFRQFAERSIPIGPALAKTMGVAESAVRDLISNGKVDFATFEKAFRSLNKEGNFAFGGMVKLSKTLEGRLSTLKDNFIQLQATTSKVLTPALKAGATALTSLIQQIEKNASFKDFLITFANKIPNAIKIVADGFIFLNDIFQGTLKVIEYLRIGVNTFFSLMLSGVSRVVEAGVALTDFFNIDTSGTKQALDTINLLIESLDEVAIQSSKNVNDINNSQNQINEIITNGSNLLIDIYTKEREAAEKASKAKQDKDKADVDSEIQKLNTLQLLKEEQSLRKAEEDAQLKALNELRASEEFEFLMFNLGLQEAARATAKAKELEDQGKHNEALKVLSEAREKAEDIQFKRRLDTAKKAKDAELKLEKTVQDQKNSILSASFGLAATLAKDGSKEQFLIQKAAAAAEIIIARGKALALIPAQTAFIPFPANLAAAAQLTTLANIQAGIGLATVAAATIKGFESGGIVGGNSYTGDNIPVRVNSGEMILNKQQQSELFKVANGGGGSGQVIQSNITVELDGDVVARAVSRRVADGLELGEVV